MQAMSPLEQEERLLIEGEERARYEAVVAVYERVSGYVGWKVGVSALGSPRVAVDVGGEESVEITMTVANPTGRGSRSNIIWVPFGKEMVLDGNLAEDNLVDHYNGEMFIDLEQARIGWSRGEKDAYQKLVEAEGALQIDACAETLMRLLANARKTGLEIEVGVSRTLGVVTGHGYMFDETSQTDWIWVLQIGGRGNMDSTKETMWFDVVTKEVVLRRRGLDDLRVHISQVLLEVGRMTVEKLRG